MDPPGKTGEEEESDGRFHFGGLLPGRLDQGSSHKHFTPCRTWGGRAASYLQMRVYVTLRVGQGLAGATGQDPEPAQGSICCSWTR